MSFVAPWFLALGAAAAVPLLLHLLRRRIGTRVEFPAARYLARAEREHSRTLRLRNLLLMLARVVAVVLVALAAARPAARWMGGGHGPTALAVVLDNSMSTTVVESGHPLIARLERMARDAFARSAPGDRLWLVTADGVVRAGSAGQLEDAVQRVSPLGGAGNPALALQRAAAAVQGSGLRAQQVALLTDGQKTAWRAAPNTGRVPVVAWVPNTVPPENRAVVSAEAQPVRWTPRGAVAARVLARDSTTYRIVLGNRTLARGTAAPGEEIMVRAAPPERGWMAGTVELDADELPADNVRHFAAWIGPATGVSAAPDAGPFVRSALDVLRGNGRVANGAGVAVVPADELTRLPALI
ncbi:MAG: vWA domain-containing protein, partial [Gemmatimonadaceae bacterium]